MSRSYHARFDARPFRGDDFVISEPAYRETSQLAEKRVTDELPLRLQSKINYVEYQREVRLRTIARSND